MKAKDRNGRIVTFYSYKRGTGRSMAVANVGWILASTGKRVLLLDWDLEAPGLHRYLHPFLDDPELASTPGLIDFFVAFAGAAREPADTANDTWFEPLASLLPYTVPVKWDRFSEGTLELVPAGRQDAAYAVRATSFDWQHFYEHGGGVFLEAMKRQLRADYDYILIDSRTGISDTSGICTVQMPDELVVLFTLNGQSIGGASAIADSADRQRRTSDGRPGLTIWPVPTRVELAEKERLEAARDMARETFDRFLAHLPRDARSDHWSRIQVLYQPYYAYEEVLAAFGDSQRTPGSVLAAMEEIAALLTPGRTPVQLPKIPPTLRREMLARFARNRLTPSAKAAAVHEGRVFISYQRSFVGAVVPIVESLAHAGINIWMDRISVQLGDDFAAAHRAGFDESSAVLYFVGPGEQPSEWREHEMMNALRLDKPIIPVLLADASIGDLPGVLRNRQAAIIRGHDDVLELIDGLQRVLQSRVGAASTPFDPEDPQKGRWGGQAERAGRQLSARVRALSEDWFEVRLRVRGTPSARPLKGEVQFHLHPTFARPVIVVEAEDGEAVLTLGSYGAFTVGAVADDGRTTLELDLAADERFPKEFRRH